MMCKQSGWLLLFALAALLIGCSDNSDPASPVRDEGPTEAESIQTAMADYPIDYCVVSGEKLGEMGEPITIEVDGRSVLLCCEMCRDDLISDSKKFLAMLDAAVAGNSTEMTSEGDHADHVH